MIKYLLVTIAVFFQGCLSTTIPAKSEFRINPQYEIKASNVKGCKEATLKISQAFSSNDLISQDMHYAQGSSKQYVYSASQWAITPNRAITDELLILIRDSKIFKNVQISKSRSRSDFIIETNVEKFMQYFDEKFTSSKVKVVINLTLINAKTNSVVASEVFKQELDVETLDAAGGVEGLNKALSMVFEDTNVWLAKVCQ